MRGGDSCICFQFWAKLAQVATPNDPNPTRNDPCTSTSKAPDFERSVRERFGYRCVKVAQILTGLEKLDWSVFQTEKPDVGSVSTFNIKRQGRWSKCYPHSRYYSSSPRSHLHSAKTECIYVERSSICHITFTDITHDGILDKLRYIKN